MTFLKKKFKFGSKAETLKELSEILVESYIPQFVHFSFAQWNSNKDSLLEDIYLMCDSVDSVIARSSSFIEDGEVFAQAGKFLSIPHLKPSNKKELEKSINSVFKSYSHSDNPLSEKNEELTNTNQVLVQKMITNVSMSGVIFTHVLSTGAPYYVINYDDESGSTDSITSGIGYSNRTIYILRKYWKELKSNRFSKLLSAVNEIEKVTGNECLDIEFAIDNDLNVNIFQVRRITTSPNWGRGLGIHIEDAVLRLKESFSNKLLYTENNELKPGRTVLGKMPDWNPAEIIGSSPRKLSSSLYRYLITDSIWSEARGLMGYSEVEGRPLMLLCSGQPYIDTRNSFSSFIPSSLDKKLTEEIVDHWLQRLSENPHFHDKVEFEIALTTWSFDYDKRSIKLLPSSLSKDDKSKIEKEYLFLTKKLINGECASIDQQNIKIKELDKKHRNIISNLDKPSLESISRLLINVKKLGTLPFSILARHAFISKTIMESIVSKGIISNKELDLFYQSINTVASEFILDLERLNEKKITENDFLEIYGHLRPGTYDVLSQRYDQRKDFLSSSQRKNYIMDNSFFSLKDSQVNEINNLLIANGFSINTQDLLKYVEKSIQGREWAKLVFTRTLSDVLEIVTAWGETNGLSRFEIANISISDLLDCLVETRDRSLENYLRRLSDEGQREYEISSSIKLPYLIVRPSDLVVVPVLPESPNFITMKRILAPILVLSGDQVDNQLLHNSIIVIESADPGYDWIFTHSIAGLVTKYGGANSHMAIRCAEFNIPAAIGCGEQIFERVVKSKSIELDCSNGKIEIENY